MKILFIPVEAQHDYQSDTFHWGLRHLEHHNSDVFVAKTFHNPRLLRANYDPTWSHCTYYGKWDCTYPMVNMEEINAKIADKFYDLIIWMDALRDADRGRLDWVYKIYGNRLFIVDGDDAQDKPYMEELKNYPNLKYFRKSLNYIIKYEHNNIFPIDFGFPDELVSEGPFEKKKLVASIIPGDETTYILPESRYYAEYRQSRYAYTYSKCGWSCLRHLEIMFNRCIPIFLDLEFCPEYILHFYPKQLLRKVLLDHVIVNRKQLHYDTIQLHGKNEYWINTIRNELILPKKVPQYEEVEQQIFDHCKKHLTCSAMVRYLLNHYD